VWLKTEATELMKSVLGKSMAQCTKEFSTKKHVPDGLRI